MPAMSELFTEIWIPQTLNYANIFEPKTDKTNFNQFLKFLKSLKLLNNLIFST